MPNRPVVAFLLCAAVVIAPRAHALTPMPEEGFALAANEAMDDSSSAADLDNDANLHAPRGSRHPGLDPVPRSGDTTPPGASPADHGAPAQPGIGSELPASHRARGTARWQSLLPGAMK
jgi:hypothetical protein